MVECRVEPLSYMLLNGLVDLAFEAWKDTNFYHNHPDLPYGPDWEAIQTKENNNTLRMVAMRENDILIGYLRIEMSVDDHNAQLLTAMIRDIYVIKDKRGYAANLVRYTERILGEIGAKRAMIGHQDKGDSVPAKFYKAMGYELREHVYGKTIH